MAGNPRGVVTDPDCVFCQAVADHSQHIEANNLTVALRPRTPKREGHVIFVTRFHLVALTEHPATLGYPFQHAAWYAHRNDLDVDIETRFGGPHHLSVHLLPREG